MRNLDRENSFQLQVAPSNIFVKSLDKNTLGFLSESPRQNTSGLKTDQRWKRSTLRTEVRRVPTY